MVKVGRRKTGATGVVPKSLSPKLAGKAASPKAAKSVDRKDTSQTLPPNQEGLHKAAKKAAPRLVYGTYIHLKSGPGGLYREYGYAECKNTWRITAGETKFLAIDTWGKGGTFTAEEDESGRVVLRSQMAAELRSVLAAEPDFWDKVYAAIEFLKDNHVWLKSCMRIDDSMDNMDDLERLTTGLAHVYDWDFMRPDPWYFQYCDLRKILEDLSESRPKE